uniref:PDEase domain-containing protein n=1 Tax=Hyaloperonospora arabidopsidis (strain Emoy2) TaxID=559515 RepID=M4BXW4_HYAAE
MVLATDNSVHSACLGKLDNLVKRSTREGWNYADPNDERLVLQMALHTADVSNPTKPLHIYLVWADRIKQEFYQQGDKERELLLPVSIGYDRKQPIPLEKMQAGFIIGIVRPLILSLSLLPSARLHHCVEQLDANLGHWQRQIYETQSSLKVTDAWDDEADARGAN